MKYKVILKETLTYEVEVEAENEEIAEEIAKENCNDDCLLKNLTLGYELEEIEII